MKEMEQVYEELNDAKTEIENLKEEIKVRALASDTLKRAHNEQLSKLQDKNAKVEKQAQELNEKKEELFSTKKMCEELKSSIKEKESIIKHLNCLNDKLRVNRDEKLKKCEDEKKDLVEKFDDASSKNMEHEKELTAYKEEIKRLKSLLSALENKCLEVERKAKALQDSGQRDDILFKLEEESRKVEDQLKWKNEHFKHLEEAHKKLRDEFKESEKQWEMERSTLLDEVYKLEDKLDSQTRISEDLQSRLQMCHQALAHEESRRKVLEVQFSETKTHFDSVVSECEEAKMEIESLTGQRDKEIASLRDLLGRKEMVYKEMEFRVGRLEHENQDLKVMVKEFQEAQIHEKGTSSLLSKLQNKLKGLEQTHKVCSKNLKAKEAEWASIFEIMDEDLHNYKTGLENKNEIIKELEIKCDGLNQIHQDCHLKLSSVEAQWTAQVEIMAKDLSNCKDELEGKDEVIRELEIKCEALDRIHQDCSSKLKFQEDQWTIQLENMAEDLSKYKTEIESKDHVTKELEMKCELLDQVHRDCATTLRLKEAEVSLQSKKFVEDLVDCRTELEGKNEVIKELTVKMEILDQIHRDCSVTLKKKEAEWVSQFGKMGDDLSDCRYDLDCKNEVVKQLKAELEVLKQDNRDILEKLRAKEAEWGPELEKMVEDLSMLNSEIGGKDEVMKELQMALEDVNLSNMQLELQNEEKALMLLVFKSVISDIDGIVRAQKCIDKNDEKMVSLTHSNDELERDLRKVCHALREANDELAEMFREGNELEFELFVWKSIAERLNANFEEFINMRRELEASLLAQTETEENLVNAIEEKDRLIECLNQELEKAFYKSREEIEFLEQEWLGRELEGAVITHMIAERDFDQEREDFRRNVREKDRRLKRKQEELNLLLKAWEKIATDELAKEVEIQEKTLVIAELESDLENLQRKFDSQQKDLFVSEKERKELESEKGTLYKEKERMMEFVGNLSERVSYLTGEDMNLVSSWERIIHKCDNDRDELFDPLKENTNMNSPYEKTSIETTDDGRSPLRALNH